MLKVGLDINNPNHSSQVTNILFTSYNVLRQKENGTSGTLSESSAKTDFSITIGGMRFEITREAALKAIETAAKEQKLQFKEFDRAGDESWYGTASPYLNFFVGFFQRATELRMGHGKFVVGKTNEKIKTEDVSHYGLMAKHHVFLEGLTIPPEKRSAMAQSLGAMTMVICLFKCGFEYRSKWVDSIKRTFAHICPHS